ncbi:MAG TPA: hypothetical protein VK213_12995 [Bacteroidales bacterium]|nr:hypothetical protein [Bacteroidales bacterium]
MLKFKLIQSKIRKRLVFLSLASLMLCFTAETSAQSDFSGRWQFDKSASSHGSMYYDYDGSIVRLVVQDGATLTYSDIYIKPGNPDWETGKETFRLDGNPEKVKGDDYSITKSARWSADKKSVILSYLHTQLMNGESRDFLNEETYILSEDRKKLTIESYSKDPVQGEKRVTNVYNRK